MFRKILKYGALLLLVLAVAGILWLVYLANTRLPQLEGTVTSAKLQGAAKAVRDNWGIPHITAENEYDAYFALGYCMGQDRLFQMELLRRLARGELSELLGPTKTVEIDKIMRAFRLRQMAEDFFSQDRPDLAEVRQVAQAFVDGINHCLDTQPLPFEFTVLQIPVRPFQPEDCMTVAAILPISFADGLRGDALVTLLTEALPEDEVMLLFPGYSKETPVTVMESLEEAKAWISGQIDAATGGDTATPAPAPADDGATAAPPAPDAAAPAPEAEPGPQAAHRRVGEGFAALDQFLTQLFGFTHDKSMALGSNSWVLAPERTESGKAILANDPHIGFTNPSIWYEAHLKYQDFENYGYHLPLIPFPLIGHNEDKAWALTMFANDDLDLFLETFKEDDPNKVMYQGEWTDVRVEQETIKVRFGNDVTYDVRVTPHGPVVTDLFKLLGDYNGQPISMRWVWQQVDYTDMLAFYRMGHARTYDEFAAAIGLITSPGVNVSYADAAGNIAWWAAGKIPVRPKHVNSKSLLDGASGKDEILGYVPFEQNPHLKNPAWGYIVTANNMSTVKPVGEHGTLQGYWQPGDRAARIEELIESREKWDIETLQQVQLDTKGWAVERVLAPIFVVLDEAALADSEKEALEILHAWDGRHDVDSTGATIYQYLTDSILQEALEDEIGEKLFWIYGSVADHWNFMKYAINDPDLPFWDNVKTEGKETLEMTVLTAFRNTVADLQRELGQAPGRWQWGQVHTLEFKHPFGYVPLLGYFFNIGPFAVPGAAQVINNMLYSGGTHNYDVIAGPSTRRLIDFGDVENSISILPTGNSGNFMSPHYDDQAEMFCTGRYRPVNFTEDQIRAHQENVLTFSKP
ncbi:MAG: penicillin acylase family protein [Candidatus Hydrogenedentes bacterium]|nr:penicillin acylase family protein [Candidatus Hydrogenedentota bacterium]